MTHQYITKFYQLIKHIMRNNTTLNRLLHFFKSNPDTAFTVPELLEYTNLKCSTNSLRNKLTKLKQREPITNVRHNQTSFRFYDLKAIWFTYQMVFNIDLLLQNRKAFLKTHIKARVKEVMPPEIKINLWQRIKNLIFNK